MSLVETVGSYCICVLMVVGTSLATFLAMCLVYIILTTGRFIRRGPL